MTRIVELVSSSEADTERLGRELAPRLSSGDVVYLYGDLGAGKTSFVRGLASGLGAQPRQVASPTFAILHEYAASDGKIVLRHLDLYRLRDDARELDILGLPDSMAGAPSTVEWPREAIGRLLPPTIEVWIESDPDGSRRLRVSHLSDGEP